MGVLFSIIGITLSLVASITLIKRIILSKVFIVKKAKVVGFEGYTYVTPGVEYNTTYNTKLYPIIEVEDENEVFKIAISLIHDKKNLKKGDEIEVIYPKGKLDKIKINTKEDIYNFYYLTLIMGIVIFALSITMI